MCASLAVTLEAIQFIVLALITSEAWGRADTLCRRERKSQHTWHDPARFGPVMPLRTYIGLTSGLLCWDSPILSVGYETKTDWYARHVHTWRVLRERCHKKQACCNLVTAWSITLKFGACLDAGLITILEKSWALYVARARRVSICWERLGALCWTWVCGFGSVSYAFYLS